MGRGHWHHIDKVIWVDESDADSEGMRLAQNHGVEVAPFYILVDASGDTQIYKSALKLAKEHFTTPVKKTAPTVLDPALLPGATAQEAISHALKTYGEDCAIAFSGSDDVVLIDMAKQSGLPFSVVVVDTGRLHPATYRFIEEVREHYGISIEMTSPEPLALQNLVRCKGLFSFRADGHKECCQIRKVEPLRGCLQGYRAWMTGQRKDQSVLTRADLQIVEMDTSFVGKEGALVKFNPIANWSRDFLWQYIRNYSVPHNALHHQGYASIGCEPCTRPVLPGQHEREGRWWWEDEEVKECGLHAPAGSKAKTGL